jgi:hypothetical protein
MPFRTTWTGFGLVCWVIALAGTRVTHAPHFFCGTGSADHLVCAALAVSPGVTVNA